MEAHEDLEDVPVTTRAPRRSKAARSMLAAVLGACVLGPAVARADDPPRRPLPDYAGRPPPPPTPGQDLLWVPRVIFSPVYFTTEFLIRRPIGALEIAAERANIPNTLYNFFTFGPEHKSGIVPIAFVDFGVNPSLGVYAFWDDAFFKGDNLRMHFVGWPDEWLGGSIVQRIVFPSKDSLQLKLLGIRRPDQPFFGIGPSTLQSSLSRYGIDKVDGSATFDFPMWRASKVEAGVGVHYAEFYDGHYHSDPGIEEEARTGAFALPDGYPGGYTAEYNHLLFALDSRRPFPEEGSGVRLDAQATQGNGIASSPASGWLRWQGSAGGFLDVDGHRRVVSLSLQTLFADPLGSGPIPFTELVSLGGDVAPMPGFYQGRLIDRSAAVATLRYRWPVGPFIDGSMQAALGNVFGEHLEGFEPGLLRFSGAIGLESDSSPDSNFQLLVGFGTETFDHGGQIDSFRLSFGISNGL
jgi:hypothetical protein